MRSSRLLLAGGLLLLLAGLWFVLRTEPGAGETGPAPVNGSAADAAAERAPADGVLPEAGGMGRVEASGAAVPNPDDWTNAEGPRLRLRVLDLFTLEPAANVELWVFDPQHYDRAALREALAAAHDDWEPLTQRFARRTRTDEDGFASLPQPVEWFRILARSGARYGELHHPRGTDGQIATLYLEPDRTLRVRVVNGAGEPLAGAPVGLLEDAGDWSWWRHERRTDAEGRARFAHLQDTLEGVDVGRPLWLTAAIPQQDGQRIPIRLDAVPSEEQVLTLAGYGSLRVRLFDADQRAFTGRAMVLLQGAAPRALQDALDPEEFEPSAARGSHSIESENGEAFFPYVGLGLTLTVAADFDGTENWEATECLGPDAAGVTATVEIRQQVLRPSFLVRLLAPDGQPLRDAPVMVHDRFVSSSWTNLSRSEDRTDEDGRVQRAIGEDWMENQPDSRRWIEFVREESDSETLTLGARIEGRASWRVGVNDLGDLRMEALPVLAVGRVVSARGDPVPDADVAFAQRFLRSRGRESWRSDGDQRVRSDRDGRFRLIGFPRAGTFRIEARHRDHPMAFVPWVEGAQEHLIELGEGRFVTGQILRDPSTVYAALDVQLVDPNSEPGSARVYASARVERNGRFQCGPGVPELADLWVTDADANRLLWRARGVKAHGLDDAPDGRLDPLDLRGRLRLVRVQCRTPDGAEAQGNLNYALTGSAAEAPENWLWVDRGSFGFLAGEDPLHLWLQSEEYKRIDLKVDQDSLQLTLEPGPLLRVALEDRSLLEISEQLYVELTQMIGEETGETTWIRMEEAEAERRLSVPGDYRMRLFFPIQHGEDSWTWIPYPPEDGLRLQLRDVIGPQLVRLPWTAAAVREAIEAKRSED